MEISTWPVFFPVMNLQETLSSALLWQKGGSGSAGGCVSNFLWQQQQHIPAPHTDLHNAAFIDCEEIVIHSSVRCSHGSRNLLSSCPLPPSHTLQGEEPARDGALGLSPRSLRGGTC